MPPKRKVLDEGRIKRVALTIGQKAEICRYKAANPNATHLELAEKFGTKRSTISTILNESDKWCAASQEGGLDRKKLRASNYPLVS